ncbi:MAG: alpha-L-fucosidase [Prevotella sp.]|nr:alpha-L-fucosidase [Prevotella sp.]
MKTVIHHLFITLTASLLLSACASFSPNPFGAVPTDAQLEWQRMEINMFCHFGPNTFTGAEWGSGEESKEVFAPTDLNCRQWVDVAEAAGIKGIILTAKHHDGFCLWPSAYSTHTVSDTLDVLRSFVDACHGRVKAGVYISPWDRNHPTYGTEKYNKVFVNTLREVHENYGPFFEQWFDGACGEGPNGKKQHYAWPRFIQTVYDINPECIVFSDIGPGCRWVGNEEGHTGDPCWSTLNTEGATPSDNKPQPSELETGHQGASSWVPAEVDVSIRPGWFWHADEHPKSVTELMEIYYNSVGRNGLLLLNVPPDPTGRIPAEDSAMLVAFRAERDRIFGTDLAKDAIIHTSSELNRQYAASNLLDTNYHTYWATDSLQATITLELKHPKTFDIIVLQEYIPLGQRVCNFHVICGNQRIDGTTIGYKRILRLPEPITTDRITVVIDSVLAPPVLNRISLHLTK